MKIYAKTEQYDFDQFLGTNYWVRVDWVNNNNLGDTMFVKILQKYSDATYDPECGRYKYVGAYINLWDEGYLTYTEFSNMLTHPKILYGDLQKFTIHLPLEVYTTEDFLENYLPEVN